MTTFNFSFTHPAISTATAGMTVAVRNANAITQIGRSNTFAVVSNNPNLPGVPQSLSLITAANQSLTVGFSAPSSGGALDSGSYQLQYKVHTASQWTAGPTIPYCTNGVGSFTDANNTVWDIRSGQIRTTTGGLTTVDQVTSSVTYLTMINGVFWQLTTNPANPGWFYASQPNGPWTGNIAVAPITSPGVQIGSPALATGTQYDVEVRAGNVAGFGPYCTPITASTLTPGAESFAITAIPQQFVGFPFTVSGGISNALSAPAMQYQDSSTGSTGAWTALPSPTITTSTFSFQHPPVSAAAPTMTVGVRDANATNITSTSNTFAVTTGTPPASGTFTVDVSGRIRDSSNNIFIPKGICILDVTISAWTIAQIKALFPNINCIRLSIGGDNGGYATAQADSVLQPWVTAATSAGVVVILDNHVTGQPQANSVNLTNEASYMARQATFFKTNGMVWYESANEVGPTGLTAEHVNTYNAVRNAGATSPIILCVPWGNPNTNPDGPLSSYQGMSNVLWDQHSYGWMYGQSTNQSSVQTTLTNNIGFDQNVTKSKNGGGANNTGTIGVWIGEFGTGASSNGLDGGGTTNVAAVLSVAPSFAGFTAWLLYWPGAPNPPGTYPADDLVNQYTRQRTAYGDQVNNAL